MMKKGWVNVRVRQNIPLYLQTEIQNKVSKTLQC